MGLKYWLPLTEDLQCKISGKIFSTDGWTKISGGKIGNCFDVPDYATISQTLTIPDTFSFACWIKTNDLTYPKAPFPMKFSNGSPYSSGASNKGWEFSHGNNFKLTLNDGTSTNEMTFSSTSGYTGRWYHLAFTVNSETKKVNFYLDGASAGSASYSVGKFGGTYTILIGSIYGWVLDGAVNDIRIYDHELSKKEIDELSKALVIHYSFDDTSSENTTNYSAPTQWDIYPTYWTLEERTTSGFKIRKTPGNTETTVAFSNDTLYGQMAVNDVWTSSCYLYKNGKPFKSSKSNLSNYGLGITVLEYETRDDGYFKSTFKINSKSNAYLLHERIFGDTISESDIYEIRNLQYEKKDHSTQYISGSRTGKLIKNETGLTNPYATSNLTFSSDSQIGNYSAVFNNSSIYTDIDSNGWNNCTISAWVYPTSRHSERSCILIGGYYFTIKSDGKLSVYCYGKPDGPSTYYDGNSAVPLNQWSHVAVVWDDTHVRMYINGVEDKNYACKGVASDGTYHTRKDVGHERDYGRHYTGKMSDFRMYATALTSDDIKRLYECRLSVAPNHSANTTAEYLEKFSSTFEPTKKGLKTINLVEPSTLALSDGSEWLCIFNHDLRDDSEWFTNSTEAGICTNKENRYSLLNYIGEFKSTDNKYEFLLAYPEKGMIEDGFYNRWTQTSNPNTTTGSVSGFTAVYTKWGSYNKGLAKGGTAYMNTNAGNGTWYGAIGQYAVWTSTQNIPAADGSAVNATQLWIRIDNTQYKGYFKTYDNGSLLSSRINEH